jgi:hypothetical protein
MTEGTSALEIGLRFAKGSQTSLSQTAALRLQEPFCAVDGVEHPCSWKVYTRIDISSGKHKIETFTRFKGLPVKRFKGKTEVTVAAGECIRLTADLGQFKTKYVTDTVSE